MNLVFILRLGFGTRLLCLLAFMGVAERGGFEPPIPFWSIHAFQACALNHSAISPTNPPTVKKPLKVRNIFPRAIRGRIKKIFGQFACR